MILIDSSVWIDFFNGTPCSETDSLDQILRSNSETPAITGLIMTEILQGVKNDKRFDELKEYLSSLVILNPRGIETSINAAEIYRECRKNGKTVRSTIDCYIAAIAIENRCNLLHKDRDYNIIAGYYPLNIFKP